MLKDDYNKKRLIAKYSKHINSGGGIFTAKTRKRLSGILGLSGRDRTINDFWNDVRKGVRNALVDLELFIEIADKDQVNQVLTKESLEPIVTGLIWALTEPKPDPNRAEIADMFIRWGFNYWRQEGRKNITLAHERTINEAIDLSDYLLKTSKGDFYSAPRKPGEF